MTLVFARALDPDDAQTRSGGSLICRRGGPRLRQAALSGLAILCPAAASAQAAGRPFSVGAGEGGAGTDGGLTGWLLAQQSQFTHAMAAKVHALHADPSAFWGLVALGLAYGVFHAAGPGHGKALIASYMLANERSLKRGAVMSLLAALLQAAVAVVLVGAAALAFNATASSMNRAANALDLASCLGVAAVGAWLVWKKGRALLAALRRRTDLAHAAASVPTYGGARWTRPARTLSAAAYRAAPPEKGTVAVDGCGHIHALDALARDATGSWRAAGWTVLAAGARPCAGAILMLVFALSQGVFLAGVAAAFAMAVGVAATTSALASIAVFAKATALKLASGDDSRMAFIARGFEFAAAIAVFAFGIALTLAARGGA